MEFSIRLYSTEFEIELYMGDEVGSLSAFLQDVRGRLIAVGLPRLAPHGGDRAFIVAFDAWGRKEGWLVSEAGRPVDIPVGLEEEILGALATPEMIGGAIAVGIQYSASNDDPEFQQTWAPIPDAWQMAGDKLGAADLGVVIRHILERHPPKDSRAVRVPLSDAISHCLDSGTRESYAAFVHTFANSRVGALVSSAEPGSSYLADASGAPITLGTVTAPDGRELIILFADPWEYAPRFGLQFDATLDGEGLLTMLRAAPRHPGVVVSSATVERSLQITPDLLKDFAM